MEYFKEFSEIPGFSPLFIDYIKFNSFFENRFPANKKIFENDSYLLNIASKFNKRKELANLICKSSKNIILSDLLNKNINLIENSNTLVVSTGQQVGFLGGPLYTFLKTMTAVQIAKKLSEIHENLNFVTLFWVEDNDHDNLEASHAALFSKDYAIEKLFCSENLYKEDRTAVSEKVFDSSINSILQNIITLLPESIHKNNVTLLLQEIYKEGKKWNDAFIELMQYVFSDYGILFVKASEARKNKMFLNKILQELTHLGESNKLIESANTKLEKNGYHIQAKSQIMNLFFHDGSKRFKIKVHDEIKKIFEINDKYYSHNDLINLAYDFPDRFSPNVLLRPIFQDSIMPTAAYIGGPSEIGYCCQITELYDFFKIPMPAFLSRHSATILDLKTSRFIEKNNLKPDYFFKKFNEIEIDLNKQFFDSELNSKIEQIKEHLSSELSMLENDLNLLDATLIPSAEASNHKISEIIDNLHKKINSAQKRKHSLLYEKYRQTSNVLFPEGTLQERFYSAINYLNLIEKDEFMKLLENITLKGTEKHWFIEL